MSTPQNKQTPLLGTYISMVSYEMIKALSGTGLDFVRIDYPYQNQNICIAELDKIVSEVNLFLWLRVEANTEHIREIISSGIKWITIEKVGNLSSVVNIVKTIDEATHSTQIISKEKDQITSIKPFISVQIETREALKDVTEIVKLPGLNCIQSGRSDLAKSLGYDNQNDHPLVREAETTIVKQALRAGKHVSIHELLTTDGLEKIKEWMKMGVKIFTVDIDRRVINRAYREAVYLLRSEINV